MMSQTLFELGPYNVCLWNIFALAIIYLIAFILRRVAHQSLKQYLIGVNIRVEGRRTTWLRLVSQCQFCLS